MDSQLLTGNLINEIVQWGPILAIIITAYRLNDRLRESVRNAPRLKDQAEWETEVPKERRASNTEKISRVLNEVKE